MARYRGLVEQYPVVLEIVAVVGFLIPVAVFVRFFWDGRGLSMAG